MQDKLESQSEFIIKEAKARFKNPVLLWAGGKDSTTMLTIARKAFSKLPKFPWPVMLLDTNYQFSETYEYMEKYAKEWGLNFIRYKNLEALRSGVNPHTTDHFTCCTKLKTENLANAIREYGFDAVLVGIRWDEHGVRGKESFFSLRKNPDHTRVHPVLNWSERQVWSYLKKNKVPYNPLYDRIEHGNLVYRSIGCLPPGQTILTNRSVKPIEQIEIGDKVRGKNGNYTKVIKKYKRWYKGKIIGLRAMYNNTPCWVTPEHPIYAIKADKCPHPNRGYCRPSCTSRCYKYYKNYKPKWIAAEKLKKGDFVLYPIESLDNKQKQNIDKDFLRLVGYYLAEGYIAKYKEKPVRVVFSINKKEKKITKDIKALMKKKFEANCYSRIRGKVLELTFASVKAANEFKKFGFGAKNKKIPVSYFTLPLNYLKELLYGMYAGDGCILDGIDKRYGKKQNNQVIEYTTVSENLMEGLKIILHRFKIIPSIKKEKVKNSKIGNRIIKGGPAYWIKITGKEQIQKTGKMLKIKVVSDSKTNRRHGYFENNSVIVPVTKIQKKQYNGYVHNLEVVKQHSYCNTSFLLHNCWPCTKPVPRETLAEREGRTLDKEQLMEDLRALGYM